MPSQLPPKPTSRNPQQKQQRLAMLENGFPPIPVEKKGVIIPAWNTVKIDAQAIEDWDSYRKDAAGRPLGYGYRGTGFRVEGEIFVLDLDVKDAELVAHMLAAIEAVFPDYLAGSLIRHSGGNSLAIISRISEAAPGAAAGFFSTIYGKLDADGNLTDAAHFETYDGRHKGKQFQAFGPHKEEPRQYGYWNGRTPANTRLADLYQFPAEERGLLHDILEAVLEKYLTPVRPAHDAHGQRAVYDLKPDTLFRVKGRGLVRCDDLEGELGIGPQHGVYGLMGDVDPKTSDSLGHAKAYRREVGVHHGRLVITDYSEDVTHHWEDEEAPELYDAEALAAAMLAAGIGQDEAKQPEPQDGPRRPPPPPLASFETGLAWMLGAFAHCRGDLVMPIHDVDALSAMPVKEFHNRYQKYNMPKPSSPSGALAYATRIWMGHPAMRDIDGFDMRPDMPWPLFIEEGKVYKNIWRPPHHEGAGEVATWDDFIKHLLPDTLEAGTFTDVLAHKAQRPWVPGQAVLMVAESGERLGEETTGTGRGTLFKILEKLFGWRYAKRIDYEVFAGTSSQATFTDWQADLALAFIEEGKEAGTTRYSESRSVYEHTKSMIDLAPRRAIVRAKYGKPRDATLNCSYFIATNHGNAFRIPESDRRFLILSNGERMTEAMAQRVYAWMDIGGNIAALWRHLQARDISHYNPMNPPLQTAARERMVTQAVSDVDLAVREAIDSMAGAAFTRQQVLAAVRGFMDDPEAMYAARLQIKEAFKRMTTGLSKPGERPRKERRVRTGSGADQARAYVRSRNDELFCDALDADALRDEVLKNGAPADTSNVVKLPR